jgi:type III restriction enzyme
MHLKCKFTTKKTALGSRPSTTDFYLVAETAEQKTVKPVLTTHASLLNYVAWDTGSWEQAAMLQLEKLPIKSVVLCYARNDHLEFNIPYERYVNQHVYEPDFLESLTNHVRLVLEIKTQEPSGTEAKNQAARR